MAVATQELFRHTDMKAEVWDAGVATPKRTVLNKGGRYGVTLTNTVGVTPAESKAVGPYTVSRPQVAGYSNDEATSVGEFATGVATDGTWVFEGVVSTGTTPTPTTTPQTTPVFITAAGALTLIATGNTRFGTVNYSASFEKAPGVLPVQIGA